jgi:hypothetical protein
VVATHLKEVLFDPKKTLMAADYSLKLRIYRKFYYRSFALSCSLFSK